MSKRQLEIHPEALAEAATALDWYSERSKRAPANFLVEIEKALESILNAPRSWPIYEEGCRRYPLFDSLILLSTTKNQSSLFKLLL